jgi:hypothetical protein
MIQTNHGEVLFVYVAENEDGQMEVLLEVVE